jgi:hypothetical protein
MAGISPDPRKRDALASVCPSVVGLRNWTPARDLCSRAQSAKHQPEVLRAGQRQTQQIRNTQAPNVIRDNNKRRTPAESETNPYIYCSRQSSRDKMSELVPTGGSNIVAQEQSSSVASSSSEVTKEIGNTKLQQKSSEYQSEEVSKMVQESNRSLSTSSTRIVQSSSSTVSSSVTSQRISSSSIDIEGSSQVKTIEF